MRIRVPNSQGNRRAGFTLIELLLSLSLIVVATALIGFIMQNYARNFTETSNEIRQKQLARAILTMIADDIRSVVLEQEYDGSVLEQQLGAGSGGGTALDEDMSDTGSGLASDSGSSADSGGVDDLSSTDALSTEYPPGIYGDQFSLLVEVSRLPRQEEYTQQMTSLTDASLADVPSDIKTVQYFVQTETNSGVSDDMSIFGADPNDAQAAAGFSGGLVRRALDRAVTNYAQEIGGSMQLQATGDLVAPEAISLEFAFFDGSLGQWVYEWDSSQQSLPWLVQITLALQTEEAAAQNPVQPGTQISMISLEDQQNFGVEIYELVVAIPGANLVATDAASADQAAGMSNLGL
ncbi:MAG: prepilin-type N-terminal cleavage/methylation domain-containing protein [Pirellulaceae bacterium]